jgi:hypothetical protein
MRPVMKFRLPCNHLGLDMPVSSVWGPLQPSAAVVVFTIVPTVFFFESVTLGQIVHHCGEFVHCWLCPSSGLSCSALVGAQVCVELHLYEQQGLG